MNNQAKFQTILADPPWDIGKFGKGKDTRPGRVYQVGEAVAIPYPTMTIAEICALQVEDLCADNCHLWLWATNRSLHDAFHVMDEWGFKYHNIITWAKPAGVGAYFINKTQHLLFGYRGKLYMGKGRYSPTIFKFIPKKHSEKPEESYELIESISSGPRLELFARPWTEICPQRPGWDVWGNEIESTVSLAATEDFEL